MIHHDSRRHHNDHYHRHCMAPMSLIPLADPPVARRVHRRIRNQEGEVQTRLVLQPYATPEGPSPPRYYTFETVLHECRPKRVALYLGTPVSPIEEDGLDGDGACHRCHDPSSCSSSSSCSCCPDLLVACGSSMVVIKVVPQPRKSSRAIQVDDPLREIAAMERLTEAHKKSGGGEASCHPHVMPLLDCMQDEDFIYLVLPYLPGGDLFSRISSRSGEGGLPEEEVARYLGQIVEGLLFMKRTSGIAHHDVSLENIMLDSHDTVKVIDLGMCLRVPSHHKEEEEEQQSSSTTSSSSSTSDDEEEPHQQQHQPAPPVYLLPQQCAGKPSYLSPEVVLEEPFNPFAADVWSLGVCLYAMLTGRLLYSSPDDRSFQAMASGGTRKVIAAYEDYGLVLSPCAKDLVCWMLHADASKRPTLEEALRHPFLHRKDSKEPVSAA